MKNKNFFKINFIYFTAITLVAVLFVLGYLGVIKNDILSSFLIQIVVMFAIPMLMYSLLFKKKASETMKDCGFKKITINMLTITIALGFTLYFINSFVADAFYSIITLFGYESLSGNSTITLNYSTLIKEFVLSCILPGFCEEFLHRGILLHANKKHANTKTCLIISSILFGLMHLNIKQFFYAAILGVLIGYVALVADSIIPTIIIHFMNNFLSNYFFYGSHLNWPLANFYNYILNIFMQNAFVYIIFSTVAVILLFWLYTYLTKQLLKERMKRDVKAIMDAVKMDKLTIEEAQVKINSINEILKHKELKNQQKTNATLLDKTFLIGSLVLGSLITISSFIWGII